MGNQLPKSREEGSKEGSKLPTFREQEVKKATSCLTP